MGNSLSFDEQIIKGFQEKNKTSVTTNFCGDKLISHNINLNGIENNIYSIPSLVDPTNGLLSLYKKTVTYNDEIFKGETIEDKKMKIKENYLFQPQLLNNGLGILTLPTLIMKICGTYLNLLLEDSFNDVISCLLGGFSGAFVLMSITMAFTDQFEDILNKVDQFRNELQTEMRTRRTKVEHLENDIFQQKMMESMFRKNLTMKISLTDFITTNNVIVVERNHNTKETSIIKKNLSSLNEEAPYFDSLDYWKKKRYIKAFNNLQDAIMQLNYNTTPQDFEIIEKSIEDDNQKFP